MDGPEDNRYGRGMRDITVGGEIDEEGIGEAEAHSGIRTGKSRFHFGRMKATNQGLGIDSGKAIGR